LLYQQANNHGVVETWVAEEAASAAFVETPIF
jgi:hypothetical protein